MIDNDIKKGNVSRRYGLSWVPEEIAITLSIHREAIEKMPAFKTGLPYIEHFMEEFGFTEFEPSLDKNFGFDKSLIRSQEDEWVRFKAIIPKSFIELDNSCESCGGSGEGSIVVDQKCWWCEGTGKEREQNTKPLYAVCASLHLLFLSLSLFEDSTQDSNLQLLSIDTRVQKVFCYGCAMDGEYSAILVEWLSRREDEDIPEMTSAMSLAYAHMYDRDGSSRMEARTQKNGWLNITCHGNACGLDPDHSRFLREGSGYRFNCHNLDGPTQQLTLLAGLAALHDAVAKEVDVQK